MVMEQTATTIRETLAELDRLNKQLLDIPDYVGKDLERKLSDVRLHLDDALKELTEVFVNLGPHRIT